MNCTFPSLISGKELPSGTFRTGYFLEVFRPDRATFSLFGNAGCERDHSAAITVSPDRCPSSITISPVDILAARYYTCRISKHDQSFNLPLHVDEAGIHWFISPWKLLLRSELIISMRESQPVWNNYHFTFARSLLQATCSFRCLMVLSCPNLYYLFVSAGDVIICSVLWEPFFSLWFSLNRIK